MRQARRPRTLWGKSAGDGFAAVSHAVAMIAARRAAGFVHRFHHAGFQQGTPRGERDFVCPFVFSAVVSPFFRSGQCRFHVSKDALIS